MCAHVFKQEHNYFASDETERLKHMTDVDKIASMLTLVQLEDINKSLVSTDPSVAKEAFLKGVTLVLLVLVFMSRTCSGLAF